MRIIVALAAAVLTVNGQSYPCLTLKACELAQRYYGGECHAVAAPEDAGFQPGWDQIKGRKKR
jgi:hypothetical protein